MCNTFTFESHRGCGRALILALVCVNVSLAEKVDADAAHRLASEFFSPALPPVQSVSCLLAYTCPEDAAYYVFNAEAADGGFVVVAGDDVVTPILGYSDVGTFDLSQHPSCPAMEARHPQGRDCK